MKFETVESMIAHLKDLEERQYVSNAYLLGGVPPGYQNICIDLVVKQFPQDCQDVHVASADPGKSIPVDEVRRIIDRVSRKPVGRTHWVLLPSADLMSSSAANALLKTLEEPPGQAVFIAFSSNVKQVLQTIRSRCQVLELKLNTALNTCSPDEQRFYQICSTELLYHKDQRYIVKLHQAVLEKNKLEFVQCFKDADIVQLLQALLQLIVVYVFENKAGKKQYVMIYDEVLSLLKMQTKYSILNSSLVLDRVALWLSNLDQLASE
jgi:DNA polymerase III delta prime subunit